MENILSIKNLSVSLTGKRGTVPILHDISLEVEEGHILGLVGESGSGKSMTAFAITQLLPGGRNSIVGGSINFCGQDLTEKSVAQAIELSEEKYCSVAATLRGVAEITTSFELLA